MSYTTNAAEKVISIVVNSIQTGKWKPGDKIWSESEFCEQSKISRTAVREAISHLVAVSVLKKIQGSGTYVEDPEKRSFEGLQLFKMSLDETIALMELRMILEPAIVQLYIDAATQEEIQELEDFYYEGVKNRKNESYIYYSNHFHSVIAKATKNPFVIRVTSYLEASMTDLHDYLVEHLRMETQKIGLIYHYKILKAVKERNKAFASLYAAHHLQLTIDLLKGLRAESVEKSGEQII